MRYCADHPFAHILKNRTSGSREIAFESLHAVRKALRDHRAPVAASFLNHLRNTFPTMAVIQHVSDVLQHDLSIAAIDDLIRQLADTSWLERGLQVWSPAYARVVTFSNSYAVLRLLCGFKENLTDIACMQSKPGGEGLALRDAFVQQGCNARLVSDERLAETVAQADVCVIGADMVCDEYIVNKVGSDRLARLCKENGVPALVAAGPLKRLSDDALAAYRIEGPYEKVSCDLVKIIE